MTATALRKISPRSRSIDPMNSRQWIQEGQQMAQREGPAAFESIEIHHGAELIAGKSLAAEIEARGSLSLERRDELVQTLQQLGFCPAQHAARMAQGKVDLVWALGLLVLNAALSLFVLLIFGPTWLTIPLSLLVLVSALPVEEFFEAHEQRAALREGVFLTLAIVAFAAQFWMGSIRGLFLGALTQIDAGPVTEAFHHAAPILRYALGTLAALAEFLCGYKLYRARSALLSPVARAAKERDRHEQELIGFHAALERVRKQPQLRRDYRTIGARQQLAWQAGAPQRAETTHLQRAAKGAAIALLILALSLLLVPRLLGAPADARTLVVAPDLSRSVPPESFQANLSAVSEIIARLYPGDRLLVVGITDGFGNPAILFDRRMPPERGYLGFELQAAREKVVAEWREIVPGIEQPYRHTDLFGLFALLPYLCDVSGSELTLLVFSDLRQSTKELDFEKVSAIPVTRTLDRLKKADQIPSLPGVRVHLLGVDPHGKTAAYLSSLKDFWFGFFAAAGASVETFRIDRRLPPLRGD